MAHYNYPECHDLKRVHEVDTIVKGKRDNRAAKTCFSSLVRIGVQAHNQFVRGVDFGRSEKEVSISCKRLYRVCVQSTIAEPKDPCVD